MAFKYTEIARNLLPNDNWQQDALFTLNLYELAAETAYLSGNITQAAMLINVLLEKLDNSLNRIKTYELKIQLLISQNKIKIAINTALKILSDLGIYLPKSPDENDVNYSLSIIAKKLIGKSIDSLLSIKKMTSPKRLASMRILSVILNAAYLGLPNLLPIVVAKQVDLSVSEGITDISPSAYANYGLILCGIVEDIDSGYDFGNLALNLLHKIESKEFSAKTIEIVCLAIKHWKEHIKSTLQLLLTSYQTGLEYGDFESASFAVCDYCAHSFVLGHNLIELEQEMNNYSGVIRKVKQKMIFYINELHRQTVLNLMGENEQPDILQGKAYDEAKMLPIHEKENDVSFLALFYIDKLFLCYLFSDRHQAIKIAKKAESYLKAIPGQVFVPLFYLYDALSWLAIYSNLGQEEQKKAMSRILSHEARMAKWADFAAMNYAHKLYLIQAEKHRVLGEKLAAMEMYDRAIASAKENGYIQEEALANELAAEFYLNWGLDCAQANGKIKFASCYIIDAYYCYARWGARAKIDQIEAKYSQLLLPIFQRSQPLVNVSQRLNNAQTLGTSTTSSSLDLASAITAAQTISQEIELDALLSKVMRIILENAGADAGALILNNSGTWILAALCDNIKCYRSTTPFEQTYSLPNNIINTVKRTQETILINQLEKEIIFAYDPYLIQHKPKSLVCTPVLNQGKLIGILYLENHLTADTFTPNRLEVLNLLTSQAAISIENARLYEQLEDYSRSLETQVLERTKELAQANASLSRLANLDGLTQVANRRSFDRYLQEVWQQSQATQTSVSLILCDVDYFKQYNDYYGHQAGDRVLQQVAQTLEKVVRHFTAQVARYGGEEFAVTLPEMDRDDSKAIAAQIQTMIHDLKITHKKSLVSEYITLSMGIYSLTPTTEKNWETLIQMTDVALYQAKRQGRDRYCCGF